MNLVETAKTQIKNAMKKSINTLIEKNFLPPETNTPDIEIEAPKEKSNGDFSSNFAMKITKTAKKPPQLIGTELVNNLDFENTMIERAETKGAGFINFYMKNEWFYSVLKAVKKGIYGRINLGCGKKAIVEFVSANPTGPMHMGNARGGALGDCLAGVLEWAGYDVTREFYINDAGNQIEKFALSLEARYIELITGEENFPEDGYHGEDIKEHMKEFIKIHGDKYINTESSERKKIFAEYALEKNIAGLKTTLENYRINYDIWFRESSLYKSGEVDEILRILEEKGHTYKDGNTVWLKATAFGGEKDEVLVRNNGIPTYFAADIAYHRNKLEKRGFDLAINIWGADHYGHVPRMKKAMEAIGIDSSKLEIIIIQLVRLMRGGQVEKMSKRTGKSITLTDLLEEAGVEAARFFFNMRQPSSHLDFDLELAAKMSNENPVYYVQYAYARICSILRSLDVPVNEDSFEGTIAALLKEPEELEILRKLIYLPEEIRLCALALDPSGLTKYLLELAGLFHTFYTNHRVKVEDEKLMKARLILIQAVKTVIEDVLEMLKITAPEKM